MKPAFDELARDFTGLGNPAVLFMLALLVRPELWSTTLVGLVGIEVACRVIKVIFFVPRPSRVVFSSMLGKSDAGSFPSIHAARSAFVCLTLCFHSDALVTRAILLSLPIVVGVTRVMLRQHRVVDVLAGLAIGVIAAFMLPYVTSFAQ